MVRLTRIYTRGGDLGETSLGDGSRVVKHHPRVEAYGTVDEANALIGLARLHLDTTPSDPAQAEIKPGVMLQTIQNDLFDLGADLCTPETERPDYPPLRITASQVERLEHEIDAMNAQLAPLNSFILPGGSAASAYLHLARTVARRAERLVTALSQVEPVNSQAIKYINRLSDHLFVLARYLNDRGAGDMLWVPGASR